MDGTPLSLRAGVSHWLSKISAKWRRYVAPIKIERIVSSTMAASLHLTRRFRKIKVGKK